ncbi:Ger(x)C family spore germination protein [Paenibacillus sp. FJAT-26967]|uniref:Ger(x)C family spore germination protein n=1 Tax=Paenibacillus sp. FJAT-26967 TaxID=1729690 RepID=UPI0008384210|nr:Ger(x)C family spore germination protein [Paenibacillus sp. FJAT-26967]
MKPNLCKLPLFLAVCLSFPFVLAGCWDRLEIEDRSLILGMAIDLTDQSLVESKLDRVNHSSPNPIPGSKLIRVTTSIAVPGRIPLGPSEGGSGGQGKDKPVWVVRVYGHTVDDALNNLQQQIADPTYLIHLRVIVISEEVARDHMEHLNDYFRRNSEVRRRTWLLVSNGEAARFLNVAPPLERVPTLYVLSMLEKSVKLGKFPPDYIGEFWSKLSKHGQDAYLPFVDIRQKENILIGGMALFRNNKMVGTTEPLEIGAYMAVKQINPGGYTPLVNVPGIGPIMMNTTERKSRIQVNMKDGQPHFLITVHLEQDLGEKYNEDIEITERTIGQIESSVAKETKRIIENLIRRTQAKESDIFGLGEYVRAKEPGYWNTHIKTKEKWHQAYRTLPIEVSTKVHLNRTGMEYK